MFEVSPYCQSDLNQSEIYVVDAFFELYMYVPRLPSLASTSANAVAKNKTDIVIQSSWCQLTVQEV